MESVILLFEARSETSASSHDLVSDYSPTTNSYELDETKFQVFLVWITSSTTLWSLRKREYEIWALYPLHLSSKGTLMNAAQVDAQAKTALSEVKKKKHRGSTLLWW